MQKSNKGLLVIAILLLVMTISISSLAAYKSSAKGTSGAKVAKWSVKVNDNDIVTTDSFTFGEEDITWDENENIKEGKIAPGASGKIEFEIDATESEVPVDYVIEVDEEAIGNDNISVEVSEKEGTIDYSKTSSEMKKTVTIEIIWDALNVDATNNKDLEIAGETIEIPVKVTATQKVES